MARGVFVVVLLVGGCLAPEPRPKEVVSTSSPSPRSPPSLPVVQDAGAEPGAVDADACVDESFRLEQVWRKDLRRRADETFAALDRCGKAGKITREERFWVALESERNGAPKKSAIFTTLSNCAVADCVGRELDAVRRDPWPFNTDPSESFEFFLRPALPPRHMTLGHDPDFDLKAATHCGGDHSLLHATVSGRLKPEEIQGVVRQNYSEFRKCYEAGLARDRDLKGRVEVRFVIERDGSVSKAQISRSTLPDCDVARCIRDSYPKMKFPAPDGGIVTVVYPVMLEPG